MTGETIYALSSGSPPAAIGVIRVSGPAAGDVLLAIGGQLPDPRRATLAWLRNPADGERLDRGLLLWFPGPRSATGEDVAELHIHGGRAVADAVIAAIGCVVGTRPAEPGEFTRRAFTNGVIDLTEAEGLADLLTAETECQRRSAMDLAGGALTREVESWRDRLVTAAALVEAALDFSDEADVTATDVDPAREIVATLLSDLNVALQRASAERLREGVRVVIAGPPNMGKSSLLNYLVRREAAITAPIPGTTRDAIEVPVAIGGLPFVFTDTAGIRESSDTIETLGVARAEMEITRADILLWLGIAEDAPKRPNVVRVHARCDLLERNVAAVGSDIAVSARTGEGIARLERMLLELARGLLPSIGEVALNRRQREALVLVQEALLMPNCEDPLILAESLRSALMAMDHLTGRAGIENVLDAVFERFCVGK